MADQAGAAASDVARRVRAGYELCAALGTLSPPQVMDGEGRHPTGPRAKVLEGISRRFTAGEFRGCRHADAAMTPPGLARAGPRADGLVWLSWWPNLITCMPCAVMLPDASAEEDNRCDACGHVGEPGDPIEAGTYVLQCSAEYAARSGLVPPLACCYGLCVPCSQASGSEAAS